MPNYHGTQRENISGEDSEEENLLPGGCEKEPEFNMPEPDPIHFVDFISGVDDLYPEGYPIRENSLDVGYDLRARETTPVAPNDNILIPTGIRLSLPENIEAQIRPRSGLALNHGITVLNSPGTVDPGYRGEIGVILINYGSAYVVDQRERIAQLVFNEVIHPIWNEVENLGETERSDGAYGSTSENE